MKFTYTTTAALICALVTGPIPAVCLKSASEAWVSGVPWFPLREFLQVNALAATYFVVALVVGIIPPLCVTIALRDNKPNVVFATFGAPGVVVMHLTLAVYFENTLTAIQWLAIGIIVFGAFMLRKSPSDPAEEALADVIFHDEHVPSGNDGVVE